jgi:hypothetical protein
MFILYLKPERQAVLDFMELHGVYQKDIDEYTGLKWESGSWNTSY